MAGVNPIAVFSKDPGAILDYVVDWTDWLAGDTILTSVWTVPAGITKASDFFSAALAVIWLVGGTNGTSYKIVNTITTAQGRTDSRTFSVNAISR